MQKPAEHPPKRVELMAPAGSVDAGYAAFHYGADSIYLGLKQFSARADAVNVTPDELDAITAYAHSLQPRRKVFVTVNTLVLQDELSGLVEQLGALADIGVDALILQDLGVYRIARRHFPELRLHASAQLAIHNRAGVETLKELGFARVTLARELTLDEIRELIEAVPDVETEAFIHGALCYSYSGLCLFSSHRLGRSGNRGRCAYLCRDEFRTPDGKAGFFFSMKDLALPEELAALRKAGVSSFKIEGRMKSPLYVAATTNYYRKLIDGNASPAEQENLKADIQTVFSRPWTELYTRSRGAKNVIDRETVGHRGAPIGAVDRVLDNRVLRFRSRRAIEVHDGLQIDIPGEAKPFGFPVDALRLAGEYKHTFEAPANTSIEVILPKEHPEIPRGATVYHASSQKVKRQYLFDRPKPGAFRTRRPLHVSIQLMPDRLTAIARVEPELEITDSISGPFQPAKDAAKTEAAARNAFEKLGDTPFTLGQFEFKNPNGLFAPVSQMNELRRQMTADIESRLAKKSALRIRHIQDDLSSPPSVFRPPSSALHWSIKVDRIERLKDFTEEDWKELDEVVVEIAEDSVDALKTRLRQLPRDRVRLALPMITRKWEEKELLDKMIELQRAGWTKWEIANMSGWNFLKREMGNVAADWSVYVTNSEAARQVLDMGATRFTLSPEDGLENMRKLLAAFEEKATLIVYQDTPLFISESCVRASAEPCPGKSECSFEKLDLVSSHGDDVIAVNRDCRVILIGKDPFCLAGRIQDLTDAGASSLRADFINRPYTPSEVLELWRAIRDGRNPPRGHIGNFQPGFDMTRDIHNNPAEQMIRPIALGRNIHFLGPVLRLDLSIGLAIFIRPVWKWRPLSESGRRLLLVLFFTAAPFVGWAQETYKSVETADLLKAPQKHWARPIVFKDTLITPPENTSSVDIEGKRYAEFSTREVGVCYADVHLLPAISDLEARREYLFFGTIFKYRDRYVPVIQSYKLAMGAQEFSQATNTAAQGMPEHFTHPQVTRPMTDLLAAVRSAQAAYAKEKNIPLRQLYDPASEHFAKALDIARAMIYNSEQKDNAASAEILAQYLSATLAKEGEPGAASEALAVTESASPSETRRPSEQGGKEPVPWVENVVPKKLLWSESNGKARAKEDEDMKDIEKPAAGQAVEESAAERPVQRKEEDRLPTIAAETNAPAKIEIPEAPAEAAPVKTRTPSAESSVQLPSQSSWFQSWRLQRQKRMVISAELRRIEQERKEAARRLAAEKKAGRPK